MKAEEQRAQLIGFSGGERALEEGAKERNVGGKGRLEELVALGGQADTGASAIISHGRSANQSFGFQPIQYAGECTLGHQGCRREFSAGQSLRVTERRDYVELGWSEPKRTYMAAVRAPKCEIGLDQGTEHFEVRIVFQVREVHRGRD